MLNFFAEQTLTSGPQREGPIQPQPQPGSSRRLSELGLDDSPLRRNQRSIAAHIDDDHYVRRFTPGDFTLSGAAAPTHVIIPAATPRWPAIEMPDGNTSHSTVSWEKPSQWRAGKLRVRIWYTSDVGSTSNFLIQTAISSIRASEVLLGTTLVMSNNALAGPSVANTPLKADVYSTTSFTADVELFSLRVQRVGGDASDTNVNDFYLLYVRVEHIPAQRESQ